MIKECPIFNELKANLITPLLKNMELLNIRIQVTWLLSDTNDLVTLSVAKFIGVINKFK